jgi:hypothetical protein
MKVNKVSKIEKEENRWWIKVDFTYPLDNSWMPSFIELAQILRAIAIAEDDTYSNGKGRIMMEEFLRDAIELDNLTEQDIKDLKERYKFKK